MIGRLRGGLSFVPALAGGCICLLVVGIWSLTRPFVDPRAQTMAHSLEVDPVRYQDIWDVMGAASTNKAIQPQAFARTVAATNDPNANMRMAAYDALRSCGDSVYASQAKAAVDRMPRDQDPSIRRKYAWSLFIMKDERWREAMNRLASSADPKDQEAAKTVWEAAKPR